MPIDPQSIASIGQNTADIGGAVQKAYTLSDAIDRTQMNKMTLASAQEEQANLGKLKSISSKFDLSTAEGQNSYAVEAMKIDPKLGMQVQKSMNETQRGALELDSAKLAIYKEQNEAWGNILAPAADMIKQGMAAGKTPAEIQMSVMPLVQNGFKTLQAVKLSNGASPIPPEAAAQVTSLLSANDPNVFIKGIMDATNSFGVSRTKLAALEKERMGLEKEEGAVAGQNIEKITRKGSDGKPHTIFINKVTGEERDVGIAESAERPQTINVNTPTAGDVSASAKAIAEYRRAPPSARSPGSARIMAEVFKANPDYDETSYGEKVKAVRDFGTGKQGDLVRSLNVSVQHLAALEDITKGLNNSDTKVINRFYNSIASEFGKSNITDFNAAKQVVADEVVKAVLGSGAGTGADREAFQAQFNAANSPEQLAGVIATAKKLMGGQLSGLRQQYMDATGLDNFDKKLSKQTIKALESAEPSPPAASGTTPVPPPATGGTGAAGGTQDHGAAMQWAQANPNDPRAQAIMAKAKAAGAQ